MPLKKNYSRRDFIMHSAISGVGLGLSPSPLKFFHPEEIIFSRYKDTRIFLPPNAYKNEQVLIYTDDTYQENNFSLVRAFGGVLFGSRFAVVFYKIPLDFSRPETLTDIENILPYIQVQAEKNIVWIDSLSNAELGISFTDTCFKINAKNDVKRIPVGFGKQVDFGFHLDLQNTVPKVSFDQAANNLLINLAGNDELKLTANGNSCSIVQMEIPLFSFSGTKLRSGIKNPGGCVRFGISKYDDIQKPILPFSPARGRPEF